MLISNSIRDGIISHDEFLEVLKDKKEYNGFKNEECLKKSILLFFKNYYKQLKFIVLYVKKTQKIKIKKFLKQKMKDLY